MVSLFAVLVDVEAFALDFFGHTQTDDQVNDLVGNQCNHTRPDHGHTHTPQLADAWTEIVRDGIAPAKQISQFDPRSSGGQTQQKGQIKLTQDTRGNWLVNGQPFNAKDPVHAQAMQSLQQQAGGKP